MANYFGGSISVLPVLEDGKLGKATDVKVDAGKIGPARAAHAPTGSFAFSGHDRTHAHQIQPDPSGKYVLHVDLGLDTISVWRLDATKGTLTANDAVALPPGDGPRHFQFHPNGKWLYSVQEEGSTIVRFDYNADAGTQNARQTISTLPRGFAGSNFCSEILSSADGKFIYVLIAVWDFTTFAAGIVLATSCWVSRVCNPLRRLIRPRSGMDRLAQRLALGGELVLG